MKRFKIIISAILCLIIFVQCFPLTVTAEEKSGEILPSTWASTDGLGRTLTTYREKREDKFVGMFYWIWHYPWTSRYSAVNNTEIMSKYPEAKYDFNHPAWGYYDDGVPQFWDEPLFGYYTDLDEYVLRKHAELLADADIDVIIFDTTNEAQTFSEGYEKLFEVWEKAKADGVDVPQISFILNFFDDDAVRTEILQLYNDVYSKGRYEDLWFRWEGKPLLMGNGNSLNGGTQADKEAKAFFTFRDDEPGYFTNDTLESMNRWGWCSSYPQTKFGVNPLNNTVEEICVSVAQNANKNGLCAMNNGDETVQGRNFARGNYSYTYEYQNKTVTVDKNTENLVYYGLNFQQQWDYALRVDPDFIFVTGFNEWIAGRFKEWQGTVNASPDQYNTEYSRDIEPSKGILKDYYYCQLCENVRRFKGTDIQPETNAEKTIDITNGTKQWESVLPEYNHYTGSTRDRNNAGWKGSYYENHTMRNDIVTSKVAYDDNNIYFYVKTANKLTSSDGNAWMRLFVDTDTSGCTSNWESFEYVINRTSPVEGKITIEKSNGGWNFSQVATGSYSVDGNVLQISVPRASLGLDKTDEVKFNFKWSDNMQTDGDIMDFYQNGDVAPGGRFTFVFDSTADGNAPEENIITSVTTAIRSFFNRVRMWIKECYYDLAKIAQK